MNIKEMVNNGQRAKFMFYRQKELWYVADSGFEFPVPIDDVGDGVFNTDEKAILLMRYIRKHIDSINSGRTGS